MKNNNLSYHSQKTSIFWSRMESITKGRVHSIRTSDSYRLLRSLKDISGIHKTFKDYSLSPMCLTDYRIARQFFL
jgi:hypothetical protein